ncbi:MAG: hypothetical protein J5449_08870 [Oscillospiraceae bacterium]|nr:hypothetical protein [Oscillospiraceae bacterium]
MVRRITALLAALALCLGLCACRRYLPENSGKPQEAPPVTPAEPAAGETETEPLTLDALNVEFAVGARDVNELLTLQKRFPDALINALGAQRVDVGKVDVTFSPSGEATQAAMKSGAVQLAFLPAEDYFAYPFGTVIAAEKAAVPELTTGLILSADGGERLVSALRKALPDLKRVLSSYTSETALGTYVFDEEALTQLERLHETGDAQLCAANASVGGKTLTLRGVGHRLNDYLWGIRAIEVYDGETLVQTVSLSDASDDPDGGLDEYSSCPEPEQLFRAVDVNFDGYDDIEVFGWLTNNTIPYFYWLWNSDEKRYEYAFRLQGTTIDPADKTLSAEYRESAELFWRDVYEWRDGVLTQISHEQITE